MLDDLLPMLDDPLGAAQGARPVYWSSTTFMANWDIQWADSRVVINARWKSVSGGYEDLLNSRNRIEVDQQQFVGEWKVPLQRIIAAVEQSEIHLVDAEGSFARLRRIEAAIPACGRLYGVINPV
jgi:hypothetical protein